MTVDGSTQTSFFPLRKAPFRPRVSGAFSSPPVQAGQGRPAADVLWSAVTLAVCVVVGALVLLGAWMWN